MSLVNVTLPPCEEKQANHSRARLFDQSTVLKRSLTQTDNKIYFISMNKAPRGFQSFSQGNNNGIFI